VIDWSEGAEGFNHPANRANAISYFTGLDAYELLGVALVAGDRNIGGAVSNRCTSVCPKPGVPALDLGRGKTPIFWDDRIHGALGNVAFSDGSVQKTKSAAFQQMMAEVFRALTSGQVRVATGARPDNHIQLPR
jgi:prepilin-type processing-associated H-X9-DG protein